MYLDEILKAESYAETYVLLKQMSNEELNALMGDLVGPTKDNVKSAPNLPLTPEQQKRIRELKQTGKNMPLASKDRGFLTNAIEEAKKRNALPKNNPRRKSFQNVLQNKKLTQKPRVKQQQQPKPQQPPKPKETLSVPLPTESVPLPTEKVPLPEDSKTENAMRLFDKVQENKRKRNQTVPSPKTTGRTMTNEEMQQRMAAKNKPKPKVRKVVKPIPQENIKPDTQQTAQQPQQKPKKSLSQRVKDKLRILPKIEGKGNKNKLGLKTQSILDNTQRVARRRNKPADRRIRSKSQ
tara:strand:- start:20726 stop:21607 length:882 start_codon:yes stop_codon:yes gene_type:complete